ncbi:Aspartate ammonia-lyase [Myxococcus hansupus]|uniref:Aspartate ammonia-lyase n=1 Tax=Pseudomyxococcus hansupus TaxID=1297742 RepID=A0A0H4WYD4_9BACT|nr:Aspartate ammonia-lyase [Myxococcus hansupus]
MRDLRPTYDVQLPPELDVPAVYRALDDAEFHHMRLESQLSRVAQELEALSKLSPGFPPRPKDGPSEPREAPVAAMMSLMSFVDAEMATLHTRKLDLERQLRDAEHALNLCRLRAAATSPELRGERARIYRGVVLTLTGPLPADQGAQLALEYAVQGARWVPTYDLRLPRTLEEGTLRMRASVLQRTGEDWTGVKLSVSTADVARNAEVPELKALRIGRHQPPPARSGWREPPAGLDELFAGYDAAIASAPAPTPGEPLFGSAVRSAPDPQDVSKEAPRGGAGPQREARNKSDLAAPDMAAPPGAPRGAPRPPAPAAPAMPEKMKRMSSASAPSRASKPRAAPMEVLDAPPEMDFDESEEALSDEGGTLGGGGGGAEDRATPRQEPSDALLDYDRLDLASAEAPGARGRLRPRPANVARELQVLTAMNVHVNITTLISVREQETSAIWTVPAPAWSQPPRATSQHFDARFDVEARADVPSDAVWHTVPVLTVPMGLAAEYVCVPSVEPRAFRTVRLENRTPYPLLAGPVDVTLENEFLMTSPLPTMAPGSTQRLGLGVEESIKVARNTRFDEATGGMFGGSTMLTHQVSVELANRLSSRVLVEVCERVPSVPLSAEKDIKVEEMEVAPVWQKRTPLPGEPKVEGERAWRVVLQPGEAQTLKATWTVKIPGNKMLGGGNRRT